MITGIFLKKSFIYFSKVFSGVKLQNSPTIWSHFFEILWHSINRVCWENCLGISTRISAENDSKLLEGFVKNPSYIATLRAFHQFFSVILLGISSEIPLKLHQEFPQEFFHEFLKKFSKKITPGITTLHYKLHFSNTFEFPLALRHQIS